MHPSEERPMLEQLGENCCPWDELTLETFVENCLLWEEPHMEAREGPHMGAREGLLSLEQWENQHVMMW